MGLFGGLFGKKKAKGANSPAQQTTPQSDSQKKQQPTNAVKSSKKSDPTQNEVNSWIFIDDNCIIFDDEEENKFTYTDVHNKFKKMIEDMISSLLAELGISEQDFLSLVNRGLSVREHKRVFEQLLIADNFTVFKKLMLKRNKELELEALKQLEDQGQDSASTAVSIDPQIQRLTLEKEQAEIEEAIARSLAVSQEQNNLLDLEERQLQEALATSQKEWETSQEESKKREIEELEAQQRDLQAAREKAQALREEEEAEAKRMEQERAQKSPKNDTDAQQQEAEFKKQQQEKEAIKESPQKEEQKTPKNEATPQKDVPVTKKTGKLQPLEESKSNASGTWQFKSSLPPIGKKDYDAYSNAQLLREKEEISKKLEGISSAPKQEVSQESLEERKKRLQAQRELILKKKQQEREAELKKYEQDQKAGISASQNISAGAGPLSDTFEGINMTTSQQVDSKEAEKRKAIFSQIKKDLA